MGEEARPDDPDFEPYLRYLEFLARQIHYKFKAKFDPSDVVQDTVVRLIRGGKWPPLPTDQNFKAYMAVAFRSALRDKIRALETGKRGAKHEISLEKAVDASSAALGKFLVADQSSPSQRAMRKERIVQVAWALSQLTEPQRKAIELRDVQNWSVAAITAELNCSRDDLARYLRQSRSKIRELLGDENEGGVGLE